MDQEDDAKYITTKVDDLRDKYWELTFRYREVMAMSRKTLEEGYNARLQRRDNAVRA